MIVDLQRFVTTESAYWGELESMLDQLETRVERTLNLEEAKHFHYLYQRCSTDLAKLDSYASEPRLRQHLESLVSRAYAEIHETREKPHRLSPLTWFFKTFPRTFRRHINTFWLALLVCFAGCVFGGFALYFDPSSKNVLMPFPHLSVDPSERVKYEEARKKDRMEGHKGSFSASLMTHNTKVSIFTLALGITWGLGTILLLFYNGVILGAVSCDYIMAGEIRFLAGWLLPHGAIEIPAIIIAGQAGLVLGKILIGKGSSDSIKMRLRAESGDLVTLIFGVAILLIWAGIIESFFSQYHKPVLPYFLKISFGLAEIILLWLFLAKSGKKNERQPG